MAVTRNSIVFWVVTSYNLSEPDILEENIAPIFRIKE
jgi:hypothetical protein